MMPHQFVITYQKDVTILILQMSILRLREVMQLAQGCPAAAKR